MSLTSTILHSGPLLRVRHVTCQPCNPDCSGIEYSKAHALVLPLAGVYLKHLGPDQRVVGDRQHALFFNADEPYRVSHPYGGDESLAIDFSPVALADLSGESDPGAVERRPFFALPSVPLNGRQVLGKQRLANRLRAGALSELEADESALALLSACTATAATSVRRPARRRRTHARQEQRVEATVLALSGQPQARWNLEQLARRVHSSPWHLAREFRRVVGLTLHQFQLLARLSLGLERVLDSNLPLTSLAADLGFSSPSHFTAAFHRCFGCTPTQLRRDARPALARELRRNLRMKSRHRQ